MDWREPTGRLSAPKIVRERERKKEWERHEHFGYHQKKRPVSSKMSSAHMALSLIVRKGREELARAHLEMKTCAESEKEGFSLVLKEQLGQSGRSSSSCLSVWTWYWTFWCPQMLNISVQTPLWWFSHRGSLRFHMFYFKNDKLVNITMRESSFPFGLSLFMGCHSESLL